MSKNDLSFSLADISNSIEKLREENQNNIDNKKNFVDYIETTLEPKWTTQGGQEALKKLYDYINNDYQKYVDYVSERITDLEKVLESLRKIDLV